MQLRTYTNLWKVEKRLYKFYDVNLPYPVSLRQIGTFAGSAIPWWLLMSLLHVPFASPWHLIWLAPPAAVMIWANRPVAEGKTFTDFIISQIKFFFGHRVLNALRPEKSSVGERITMHATVWDRTR